MPAVDLSELPTTESRITYNKRDLLIYACGIGEEDFRYTYELNKDFQAFPSIPVVLGGYSQDVTDFSKRAGGGFNVPGVKLDLTKLLDGERMIELYNPLPLESKGELIARGRTTGVYDIGKACIMESETVISDASGKKYAKIIGRAFFRDAGGFGGPAPPKPPPEATPPKTPAHKVVVTPTRVEQAQLYRLSSDYNPLHIDPVFSGKVGFKVPILHGLCSYAQGVRAVLQAYGENDGRRLVSYRTRFTHPVLPGQTLSTELWKVKEDAETITVAFQSTIKEIGKVALGGGVAVLKKSSSPKL
ncbi:hypothetical protein SmJEL517_g02601 [Synchytrium microbalum]|uniref:Uncharacterized protein n=1 Tax=Synchytrium microbalum TaxID=1806994 RepID=A0A507C024_9FUNG|nr:uncharacterized protein SmJEL517_g02601 [Synchytrium microbalum]TPX34880.1 hypothetical protein SmJEL517_g02601 [Synchytrium microbalum]